MSRLAHTKIPQLSRPIQPSLNWALKHAHSQRSSVPIMITSLSHASQILFIVPSITFHTLRCFRPDPATKKLCLFFELTAHLLHHPKKKNHSTCQNQNLIPCLLSLLSAGQSCPLNYHSGVLPDNMASTDFERLCSSTPFRTTHSFASCTIPLMIDAWIRESQEASQWLEDLESRIRHKGLVHSTSVHSARSKLLELGAKLDRLESLLRNLPAKPILTDEDVEYRWKMLEDIQLRTKALVSSISAVPLPNWSREADSEECNVSPDCYDQDQTKTSYPRDNTESPKPLLSDGASRSEGQVISSSTMPMFWLWKACSTILLFLALAALAFFLALLCTAF